MFPLIKGGGGVTPGTAFSGDGVGVRGRSFAAGWVNACLVPLGQVRAQAAWTTVASNRWSQIELHIS